MGGVDNGPAEYFNGTPLALHAVLRLVHAGRPGAWSTPTATWRPTNPLRRAGVARRGWPATRATAGRLPDRLERRETPYLLTVPCDTPLFPLDLASRGWPWRTTRRTSRWSPRRGRRSARRHSGAAPAAGVLPAARRTARQAWCASPRAAAARSTGGPPSTARCWCPSIGLGDAADAFFNANTAGRVARAQSASVRRGQSRHEPNRRDRRRTGGLRPARRLGVDAVQAFARRLSRRACRRRRRASTPGRCAMRSAGCWPRTWSRRSACRRTTTRPWTASPSTARQLEAAGDAPR